MSCLAHDLEDVDHGSAEISADVALEIAHHRYIRVVLDIFEVVPLRVHKYSYVTIGLPLKPHATPVVAGSVLRRYLHAVNGGQVQVVARFKLVGASLRD